MKFAHSDIVDKLYEILCNMFSTLTFPIRDKNTSEDSAFIETRQRLSNAIINGGLISAVASWCCCLITYMILDLD